MFFLKSVLTSATLAFERNTVSAAKKPPGALSNALEANGDLVRHHRRPGCRRWALQRWQKRSHSNRDMRWREPRRLTSSAFETDTFIVFNSASIASIFCCCCFNWSFWIKSYTVARASRRPRSCCNSFSRVGFPGFAGVSFFEVAVEESAGLSFDVSPGLAVAEASFSSPGEPAPAFTGTAARPRAMKHESNTRIHSSLELTAESYRVLKLHTC